MPLLLVWQESLDFAIAQQVELAKLYSSARAEITSALEKRIEFTEQEAARLKEMTKDLEARTIDNISKRIVSVAAKAFSQNVKVITMKTVSKIVGACLTSILVCYGIAHYVGYRAGYDEASSSEDKKIEELHNTADEAAKLFFDHPEELETWGPIIRLNYLTNSSSLKNCHENFLFSFDGRPDQPGCWISIRIPVPLARPRTMRMPLPPPLLPPSAGNE